MNPKEIKFSIIMISHGSNTILAQSTPREFKAGITLISHGSSNNNNKNKNMNKNNNKNKNNNNNNFRPPQPKRYQGGSPVSFWPRFVSVRVWFTVPARYGSCRFGFCGSVLFAGALNCRWDFLRNLFPR